MLSPHSLSVPFGLGSGGDDHKMQEKISFQHQYDCRAEPSQPDRGMVSCRLHLHNVHVYLHVHLHNVHVYTSTQLYVHLHNVQLYNVLYTTTIRYHEHCIVT